MINEQECLAAGLNPNDVERIRKRLQRVVNDAGKLGIGIFMGSGCSLRADDGGAKRLIIASINGPNCDGGCGAEHMDSAGLWRGE